MTRTTAAVCGALVLIASLELRGQTPTPAPTPQPPRPQKSTPSLPTRHADLTVTVAGCMTTWDAAMKETRGGASDPAGRSADHRYVLMNVEPAGAAPAASEGSATSAPVQGDRYIVTAIGGVNLAAHVNRKVRIVGTVIDDPAVPPRPAEIVREQPSAPPQPSETPAPSSAVPGSTAPPWPSLVAVSITSLGAACRPGTF